MKNFKTLQRGLLAIGLITLFISCSGNDNQETLNHLLELEDISKEDVEGREN